MRLAAGLDEDGSLSEEAEARALACLQVFGERLSDLPPNQVRAVGTNTLRKAKDVIGFLDRARDALGHRVDVISGREEARLIYRGVVRDVDSPGCMLVMDIGGGSTELIVGEGSEPTQLDSLYMGCVSWTKRFFPGGVITKTRMDDAILAARREMQSVVRAYRKAGWQQAVGSSGTIVAIEGILQAKGYAEIDAEGLAWLRKQLVKAGDVEDVSLEGSARTVDLSAGGVAILSALMQGLRIERCKPPAMHSARGVAGVDRQGKAGGHPRVHSATPHQSLRDRCSAGASAADRALALRTGGQGVGLKKRHRPSCAGGLRSTRRECS